MFNSSVHIFSPPSVSVGILQSTRLVKLIGESESGP